MVEVSSSSDDNVVSQSILKPLRKRPKLTSRESCCQTDITGSFIFDIDHVSTVLNTVLQVLVTSLEVQIRQ